jgi:hypothetical protein
MMCCIAVVPALAISAYVAFYTQVPAYSAVVHFDQLGLNLRVDLYLTTNEARDSGRYLTVVNGGYLHTVMLDGGDWAHFARTSAYRIDENHLAVLVPLGRDYEVTLQPFAIAPLVSDNGKGWQYLGAFDFAFPAETKARLGFYDQQLAECVPMGRIDPATWVTMARPAVRAAQCPSAPDDLRPLD